MCLGLNVCGHSPVGPIMYGHKRGGTAIDILKVEKQTKSHRPPNIHIENLCFL